MDDNNANLQENAVLSDKTDENKQFKRDLFDWIEVLVHAILAVVLCFSFLFRIATIDGDSMMNTLVEGERVVINNIFYTPKAGDIVVISRNKQNDVYDNNPQDKPIIKRIIATEGQSVDIDFEQGIVYVDGVELDEPYTKPMQPYEKYAKYDIQFPVTVDEGCVFVLGDNRPVSLDSRSSQIGEYGMIDTRYILGHAVFRVFPFNKIGKIDER
mgnify:FL=1